MSNKNYFAQYKSPNIVLVSTAGHDGSSTPETPDTGQAILPRCDISAEQAPGGYTHTTHFANASNLNYFDTVYNNYNVEHMNIVNATEELNPNLLPSGSHYGSIENPVNKTLENIQQPTFQEYSWVDTNPVCYTDTPISDMYATSSSNSIKIKLKKKNEKPTEIQETNEGGRANIVQVDPENNEEKLSESDKINKTSHEKNKGTNVIIGENCDTANVVQHTSRRDKKEKLRKPTTKNNGTSANIKTKNNAVFKDKSKVTNNKKDLKYLWKRHCAKLKEKIKKEIEESEVMKTQLHAQWKAILRSEYNTFVNNFYRSALISKNKMKSVIANNKLNLIKKSNSELNNKQSMPNTSNSSCSNTKFTRVDVDNIKSTNSLKSVAQTPKRAYLRKKYENFDLRTLLRDKRNQNFCYESQRRRPKRPRERDNLIITVNQDIQTETQKPIAMEPKPKKKCKKIKLVINVVCNESESEEDSDHKENDHCALLNEDLSFLDDFNVDDIVDSLNCDELMQDSNISSKANCTDKNIGNNAREDEATYTGLNELGLSEPKMDTTEPCELVSAKSNHNIDYSPSAIINENVRKDVVETYLDTHNSLEMLDAAPSNVNIKLEKIDIEQSYDTFLIEKNNLAQRLLTESGNMETNKEVYMSDPLVLREINNIKNEFVAQIDEGQYMGTVETQSVDRLVRSNTGINSFTQYDETDIKCENTNIVIISDDENNLDQRKTVTDTEIKPDSSEDKSTPVQITYKHTEVPKVERQDLIEIKYGGEPIVISDDDASCDCVTNINDVVNMEVLEQEIINIGHEKINMSSENTVIGKTLKKQETRTHEEVTKHENKALVNSDEIKESKEDVELQDPNMNSHVLVHETKVITSKDTEVTKGAAKSIADTGKASGSHEKPVPIIPKDIPKFKEFSNNKQLGSISLFDQAFVDKLEKRLFDCVNKRHKIMSIIHAGKFSKIFKCTNSVGDSFALKVSNNSDNRTMGSLKAKRLMRLQKYIPREQLNLVYMFNSFGMKGYWCFIMEYYPKNLEQALVENKKSFHINLVQVLAKQLVAAVAVLTNNSIVHTDIKPKHILLNSNNGKLKLCGFDDSKCIQYLNTKPNTGTVNYRAPEIILGFMSDYRMDVWSVALVIFEMATGKKLFPGTFNNDILFKQMCTLGEISIDMKERSAYSFIHFSDGVFMRIMDSSKRKKMIPYFNKSSRLYNNLFTTYRNDWQSMATKQEVFEDIAKLTRLHQLLEQMLVLDPRYRLPINFVGVSEFLQDDFS